jgi:hypothetical protein
MSNTVIQAIMWLTAGGAMLLFLKRRKSRRTQR